MSVSLLKKPMMDTATYIASDPSRPASSVRNLQSGIAQASNAMPIPYSDGLPLQEQLNMDIFAHMGKGAVTGVAAYFAADALTEKYCKPNSKAKGIIPVLAYGSAAVGAALYEMFASGSIDLKDYFDDCIGAAIAIGALSTKAGKRFKEKFYDGFRSASMHLTAA